MGIHAITDPNSKIRTPFQAGWVGGIV